MPEDDPLLQPCPNCATLIDVTDEEPFAQVHCPICGTSMRVRRQFNNFQIEEVLGAGGMGSVYRATDLNLQRPVALKLLRQEYSQDEEYIRKFETEARITASINHPYVVKVFAYGLDHGLVYMAMELVDKGSLDDLITLQTRVAESQVLEIGVQIAEGLKAAHDKGLIHRDVKPGNILFADAHTCKITDFGLAILMAHEAEARGEVWGTPYYVAPEKLNKDPEDFRSDIYSLGGTLFHALAGRPPFEAETASMVALKHIKSRVVSLQAFAPHVSSATAFVINRMLQQNPEERYQSYEALIEHLNYARTKLQSNESSPGRRAKVVMADKTQEKLMTYITLGILASLILGGIAVFLLRDRLFGEEKVVPVDERLMRMEQSENALEDRYAGARGALVAGRYAEAAKEFKELLTVEGLRQPMRNWVLFHYGLSQLLEGNMDDSKRAFERLAQEGIFSKEPIDMPLGEFFVETSKALVNDDPVPASVAKSLDKNSFQAIAALAYGIKDWRLGKRKEAAELLRYYKSARPEDPYDWIPAYGAIAAGYVSEYETLSRVGKRIDESKTLKDKTAALRALEKEIAKLKTEGGIKEDLTAMIPELEKDIERLKQETVEKEEKLEKSDGSKIASLEKPVEARLRAYDFAGALALVERTKVEAPTAVEQREALLKRARWLSNFKNWIIARVAAKPYEGKFMKRSGSLVPGNVSQADQRELVVSSPYGATKVPWTDTSPITLIQMAVAYMQQNPAAADVPDRMWETGVYSIFEKIPKAGRKFLMDASQKEPKYADDLERFLEAN